MDFSQPEHAPLEFRMLSYDPQRTTSLKSGISGMHLMIMNKKSPSFSIGLHVSMLPTLCRELRAARSGIP